MKYVLTKQHVALADVMKALKPLNRPLAYTGAFFGGQLTQWNKTVLVLADFYQAKNPKFDQARWLDYIEDECEPRGGKH